MPYLIWVPQRVTADVASIFICRAGLAARDEDLPFLLDDGGSYDDHQGSLLEVAGHRQDWGLGRCRASENSASTAL
jgi:hypothetical protein